LYELISEQGFEGVDINLYSSLVPWWTKSTVSRARMPFIFGLSRSLGWLVVT